MNRYTQRIAMLAPILPVALLAAMLAGCETGTPGAAPWQNMTPEPDGQYSDAEYFHYLTTRVQVIGQNDAYRGILIWLDGKDDSKHFGQRVEKLESRGLAQPGWVHDPIAPITRARLAAIICKAYNVKGGWALTLFGPSLERAARRELEYRKVMQSGGGDQGSVGGAEFVTILKKADEEFAEPESPAIASPQ